MNLINRVKIILALIRKYGIRKTWIAYRESSSDSHYVLVDCPECGTEHRIHKVRAAHGMIKCKECGGWFVVMKATSEESAFMRAFGHERGERNG